MIITFSGLDGSGKTTLIKHLEKHFDEKRIKYSSLSIYSDLSIYAFLRKLKSSSISKDKILSDEEKNNSKTYKIFRSKRAKKFFLLFDIAIIFFVKMYFKLSSKVLIIDRYFYDFIMEITDDIKLYQRFLCFLFPSSNISFFIDTSPKTAFKRKGEYSIEILTHRRKVYSNIFKYRPIDYFIDNNGTSAKEQLTDIIEQEFK